MIPLVHSDESPYMYGKPGDNPVPLTRTRGEHAAPIIYLGNILEGVGLSGCFPRGEPVLGSPPRPYYSVRKIRELLGIGMSTNRDLHFRTGGYWCSPLRPES